MSPRAIGGEFPPFSEEWQRNYGPNCTSILSSLQSWLLFEQLCAAERCFGIRADLVPVRAPALYTKTGARNPYYVLPIRQQLFREVDYWKHLYGIPFDVPQDAERKLSSVGTTAAQHFLTKLALHQPDRLKDAARFLWRRLWIQQADVHRKEDFEAILREIALPANFVDGIADAESEEALKRVESEAVEHGAFDVPFVVLLSDQHPPSTFLGFDSWPMIAKKLDLPTRHRGLYELRSFNRLFDRYDAFPE
ncbi:Glutathione S-transferase kappa [Aphelenchoides fujianensis]|nr:Glutathione S-transferase kappa [Aphelenchoides fujianensis]